MQTFQTSLFYDLQELIRNSPLLKKYYYLFKALDLSALSDRNDRLGRTGHSRHAMLRAFIVRHLEQIKSVPRLIEYLNSLPPLLEMCGFDLGDLPHESQFYRFLKNTKNSSLKNLHHKLNQQLIDGGFIELDQFILDSKPVMAATKENNLKNPRRNSQDKTKIPKRNPRASLGYYSCQLINGKKENRIFFWGYRTHTLVTKEGICLIELTLPNNLTDQKIALKLLQALKRKYRVKAGSLFLADNPLRIQGYPKPDDHCSSYGQPDRGCRSHSSETAGQNPMLEDIR